MNIRYKVAVWHVRIMLDHKLPAAELDNISRLCENTGAIYLGSGMDSGLNLGYFGLPSKDMQEKFAKEFERLGATVLKYKSAVEVDRADFAETLYCGWRQKGLAGQ